MVCLLGMELQVQEWEVRPGVERPVQEVEVPRAGMAGLELLSEAGLQGGRIRLYVEGYGRFTGCI
jgi:hypothetical protein